MRPGSVMKKAKKKKQEETLIFHKSRTCPDHHAALPPSRLSCGPESHAKFRQNWLKGFGSLSGRDLPFPYTLRYGLHIQQVMAVICRVSVPMPCRPVICTIEWSRTHNVEVFDGDCEVGIFLEALNGRWAEDVSSALNVNARSVNGHELDTL